MLLEYSRALVTFASCAGVLLGLLLYVLLQLRADGRTVHRLQKAISRAGFSDHHGDVEAQLKALIWQLASYRGIGADLAELADHFQSELGEVRREGLHSIGSIPSRLKELTRAHCVALFVTGKEQIAFQAQSEGRLERSSALYAWLHHLRMPDSLKPLQFQVQDVQGKTPKSQPEWRAVSQLLFAYLPVGIEKDDEDTVVVSVFLGYAAGVTPLPREKEILREVLVMIQRAIREHFAVKGVSDRAKLDKKQQEKYFAHISHDIRTPLNNIQAILDLYHLEGITEGNREFLQVARANCRSLRDIVEELLEFTKYRDGELKTDQKSIRVEPILEGVTNEFSLTAEMKGISFRSEYFAKNGVSVDPKHFKRVLLNLVSNAFKYTQEGEVVIRLFEKDGNVIVSVRDTGVGIPKERLQNLFAPFSRIGEVQVEGIGLGLALTKILVEMNGGEIAVESEHGAGSVFTVSFPAISIPRGFEQPSLESMDRIRELYDHSEENTEAHRILIVDDDPDVGKSLSRLLEGLSFQVQMLTRVEDVKGLLNFWKPTVVISDVHLLDGDIHAVNVLCREFDVPVVAHTGCSQFVEEQTLDRGTPEFATVLSKPAEPEQLLSAIEQAIDSRAKKGKATSRTKKTVARK